MFARRFLPLFLILLLSLLLPVVGGQAAPVAEWAPGGSLTAADGSALHHFGVAVAIDGNTAIVGAPGWPSAPDARPGAAYVFTHNGTAWVERSRLTASDGQHDEEFGNSAVLVGNVLAVGAVSARRGNPGDPDFVYGAGAVYIYTGSGATWSQETKLMPADLVSNNYFGLDLAFDGETLVVGAPDASMGHEAVYFYTRHAGGWDEPVKFDGPDQTANNDFGLAVAVAGDLALVGATGIDCCDATADFTEGIVYVFARHGGVWSPAGTLSPDDGRPGDGFGCDIAFDGVTAVVAACQAYGLAPMLPGYAYVFSRAGNTWTQTARLEPEGDATGSFGIRAVALAGDQLVLGWPSAPPDGSTDRLYPYTRDGATWTADDPIESPDGPEDTDFGWHLALSETHLLVGAPYRTKLNVTEQGSVYAYRQPGATTGHAIYVPIIAAPGLESPDGLIAYEGFDANEKWDIFLIRPDGTGKLNLTRSTQLQEASPAWSPDGARLAFTESTLSRPTLLVTTDAGGGDRRVVPLDDELYPHSPTWSPDGSRLAFVGRAEGMRDDVYVVNLDGSGLVNRTSTMAGRAQSPRWSPDGAKLLFVYDSGSGPLQLAVVGATSGNVVMLTDDDIVHGSPAWSPDGTRILFSTQTYGFTQALMTMPAGGGEPTLLLANATMGRWSPDGTQLVFVGDDGGLFRAAADGSHITPIDETSDVFSPDWQP